MIDWLTCLADDCPELGAERPPAFSSALERETLAGLRVPKRRREWLLGRWTAKRLLQRCHPAYRSLPLQAITVGNDADGAPYLSVEGEGRLAMSLSISHRDDRAFCALSPTLPPSVGADIERIEPRDPAFVHDFFTVDEDARVWTCPLSRRDTLITVVWSAKEAVLKALRHGLRVDTRRVEIVYVAGIEGNGTIAGFPPGGSSSAGWPPVETWHEIQVKYAAGRKSGGSGPGADSSPPDILSISAWWRPWEDYVLTIATHG